MQFLLFIIMIPQIPLPSCFTAPSFLASTSWFKFFFPCRSAAASKAFSFAAQVKFASFLAATPWCRRTAFFPLKGSLLLLLLQQFWKAGLRLPSFDFQKQHHYLPLLYLTSCCCCFATPLAQHFPFSKQWTATSLNSSFAHSSSKQKVNKFTISFFYFIKPSTPTSSSKSRRQAQLQVN